MKRKIFSVLLIVSSAIMVSLNSCSAVYYDVYFSQGIDSTQKFRLVIDGENWGFIPYRSTIVDCADTSSLGHSKLLGGSYKVQIRNLSDEVVISQNLNVAEKGVTISGANLSGEVKATSQCALAHFFKAR